MNLILDISRYVDIFQRLKITEYLAMFCIEKLILTGSHCLATFFWLINCIAWMSWNYKKHILDMPRSLSVIYIWGLLMRFYLRKVQF